MAKSNKALIIAKDKLLEGRCKYFYSDSCRLKLLTKVVPCVILVCKLFFLRRDQEKGPFGCFGRLRDS